MLFTILSFYKLYISFTERIQFRIMNMLSFIKFHGEFYNASLFYVFDILVCMVATYVSVTMMIQRRFLPTPMMPPHLVSRDMGSMVHWDRVTSTSLEHKIYERSQNKVCVFTHQTEQTCHICQSSHQNQLCQFCTFRKIIY